MSATAEKPHFSYDKFVLGNSSALRTVLQEEILGPKGLDILERFAYVIDGQIKEASRDTTNFINEHFKDDSKTQEDLLASHADRCRSLAAAAVLLRGGYIPALKIYSTNPIGPTNWHLEALELMLYLKSSCEAMRNLML